MRLRLKNSLTVALPRSTSRPDSATIGSACTPPVQTKVFATILSHLLNEILFPSTPVTGRPVKNSTPRASKLSVARSIK